MAPIEFILRTLTDKIQIGMDHLIFVNWKSHLLSGVWLARLWHGCLLESKTKGQKDDKRDANQPSSLWRRAICVAEPLF